MSLTKMTSLRNATLTAFILSYYIPEVRVQKGFSNALGTVNMYLASVCTRWYRMQMEHLYKPEGKDGHEIICLDIYNTNA